MVPKALAARTRPRARPGPLRSACRPRDRASALAHSRQFPTFHHQDRDAVSWGEASAVDSITDDMLETALECNAEWRSDGDGQWSVAEPTPSAAGAAGAALLEERREQQAQGVTRERELTFLAPSFPPGNLCLVEDAHNPREPRRLSPCLTRRPRCACADAQRDHPRNRLDAS